MVTEANSINSSAVGIVGNTGTAFVSTSATAHNVILGGSTTSTLTNVAPSATSGVPLVSNGAAADPSFTTAVVAGGGTGSVTFSTTGVVISGSTSTTALTAVTLTDGQLAIGSSTGNPAAATISAGNGITVTNGHNSITVASFAIQQVRTSTSALNHITTTHAVDDSVPQNTYGGQVMTVSITPKSSSTILVIECVVFGAISSGGSAGVGLFQDSTANALAMDAFSGSGQYHSVPLMYSMTSGTTSSTTFKIRVWPDSGSFDVNGISNARIGGGVASTWMSVTEYAS